MKPKYYYLHVSYSEKNDELDSYIRMNVDGKYLCLIGTSSYNNRDWEFRSKDKNKLKSLALELKGMKPKKCKIYNWSTWTKKDWTYA